MQNHLVYILIKLIYFLINYNFIYFIFFLEVHPPNFIFFTNYPYVWPIIPYPYMVYQLLVYLSLFICFINYLFIYIYLWIFISYFIFINFILFINYMVYHLIYLYMFYQLFIYVWFINYPYVRGL